MGTFKKFEDIESWKRSRDLDKKLFSLIKNSALLKDYSLKDQMLRSSGSIMDNIAEGFERGGKAEFIHFLSISKGSCGELRSQLYRAFDRNYFSENDFNNLKTEAIEISSIIQGLMTYLINSDIKGSKYKKNEVEL